MLVLEILKTSNWNEKKTYKVTYSRITFFNKIFLTSSKW